MQEGDIVYYIEQLEDDGEMTLMSFKINKIFRNGSVECTSIKDSNLPFILPEYLIFSNPVEAWCHVQWELENRIKELEDKVRQIDWKIEKLNKIV